MKKRLFPTLAAVCLLAGCASPAPEAETSAPEPLSPVYSDWSKLTPYEPPEEQYAYAAAYREDGTLQPGSDYGPLLPYIGSYLNTRSYMGPLCTLGLATADGRLVTPPVYAEIGMVRDNWRQHTYGPFLLLYRGEVTARHENEWGSWVEGDFNLTVAAPDGRWVRELPPCYGGPQLLDGQRLALAMTDGSVIILDAGGNTVRTFPASALEPYLGEGFTWQWDGGPSLDWLNGMGQVWKYDENDPDGDGIACWLDPDTGAVTAEPPPDYVAPEYEFQPEAGLTFPGYSYCSEPFADPVTGKLYCQSIRTDGSGIRDLLDEQGRIIRENCTLDYPVLGIGSWCSPWVWAGRTACAEDGIFCYYDPDGNCVFRRAIQTDLD